MDKEFVQQVRRAFEEAVERPAAQRPDFVASLPLSDAVKAEVMAMLGAMGQMPDAFLGGFRPVPTEPPEMIGPYRLGRQLGQGGMSRVYEAFQEAPVTRTVAIKLLRPEIESIEIVRRLSAEREVLSRLDHPNIARVLDAGMTETGMPYLVVDLIPGLPLTRFCDVGRIDVRGRLELFIQVCSAIAHAHAKGIIHRDIKPSNVLAFMRDGVPVVKVIDFGIAKLMDVERGSQTVLTRLGQIVGTYEYMSPEQASGSADIDTRSDVYSLGVLLYELLTGRTPFDTQRLGAAAEAEMRRLIREADPPRPSTRLDTQPDQGQRTASDRQTRLIQLRRELRQELDWVPLKAMRKEADRRYQSAGELSREIQNYLTGMPLTARPESRWYRTRKFCKRNKVTVSLSLAALSLLVLGLVVSLFQLEQTRHAEAAATTQRSLAELNAAMATLQQADAFAQVRRYEDAKSLYRQSREELRRLGDRPWIADLGLWDIAATSNPPICTFAVGDQPLALVGFLPDGDHLYATVRRKPQRLIVDLHTGQTERHEDTAYPLVRQFRGGDGAAYFTTAGMNPIKLLRWKPGEETKEIVFPFGGAPYGVSPDGRSILYASNRFFIVQRDGKEIFRHPMDGFWADTDGAFLDNHHWVIVATEGKYLVFGDESDTPLIERTDIVEGGFASTAPSPDGKRLAFGQWSDAVIYSAERREPPIRLDANKVHVGSCAWSTDGTMIAGGCWDSLVRVWDTKTGKVLAVLHGSRGPIDSVAISPDNRRIAGVGWDGKIYVWDLRHNQSVLSSSRGPSMRWAPTVDTLCDNRLAVTGVALIDPFLTDLSTGRILKTLPASLGYTVGLRGATQREIAFAATDGKVHLYDLDQNREVATVGDADEPLAQIYIWRPRNKPTLLILRRGIDLQSWDLTTRTKIARLSDGIVNWQTHLSDDGRFSLSFTTEGESRVGRFDLTGQTEPIFRPRLFGPSGRGFACFSPDGETIITRQNDIDSFGTLWRSGDMSEIGTIADGSNSINSEQFWPDPQHLLSVTEEPRFNLRAYPSGRVLKTFLMGLGFVRPLVDGPYGVLLDGDINCEVYHMGWYRDRDVLEPRVEAARLTLQTKPDNADAALTLARWYEMHAADDWAARYFELARAEGATVSPLTLVHCYDRSNQIAQAIAEYESALKQSADENEKCYLRIVLERLRGD